MLSFCRCSCRCLSNYPELEGTESDGYSASWYVVDGLSNYPELEGTESGNGRRRCRRRSGRLSNYPELEGTESHDFKRDRDGPSGSQ